MKWYTPLLLLGVVVLVQSHNTFIGTNVQRPLIYHSNVEHSSKAFRKRIVTLSYTIPQVPKNFVRSIQGILAYDFTHSEASVNITQGGLGYNFVSLRMKSDRGMKLRYDVYIYA